MKDFLPISIEEIKERGWEQLDFLFVSGDAYVDHPSFGPAVICRVLEAQGYKVALFLPARLAQTGELCRFRQTAPCSAYFRRQS